MRFLLNMNVPRELGRQLVASGREARHAGDAGLAAAADEEILRCARQSGEVIITHDLDYGRLLAFSGQREPSVVIFRTQNAHPRDLFARIVRAWSHIEKPLAEGAVVVIEDTAVRIRPLPISRSE
jgi:predicted nuclease of predicted toxin-antitoxin system